MEIYIYIYQYTAQTKTSSQSKARFERKRKAARSMTATPTASPSCFPGGTTFHLKANMFACLVPACMHMTLNNFAVHGRPNTSNYLLRGFSYVTQQTCLLCDTADTSAV